jgi:glycosyltransferase involved in cell wall biosynthesis
LFSQRNANGIAASTDIARAERTVEPADCDLDALDISLVIATRNRCHKLAVSLRAVSNISFEGTWEVIVVDNGSTDETRTVIDDARSKIPVPLINLFEPKAGTGTARNRGIKAARGRVVAFTDDDCYVDTFFLTEILQAFEDEKIGYVTGRVELYDPSDADITVNRSRIPKRYYSHRYIHTGDIIGANLAFRRSVLKQICGFDECMGAGRMFSAEDVDVAGRAASAGWDGVYRPEAVVYHHHGRNQSDLRKLNRFYNVGRGAYTIKYLLRGELISFLKGVAAVRWRVGPLHSWNRATLSVPAWELYGAITYLVLRARMLLGRTGSASADNHRISISERR